jgi:actin-related protein 5
MKDEDWDIYKAVSKVSGIIAAWSLQKTHHSINSIDQDGGGSDSEAEQEKLNDLESALKRYDPNFKNYSGTSSSTGEGSSGGFVPTAEYYQLHIGTERIRAPELFFQPSFIGYAYKFF